MAQWTPPQASIQVKTEENEMEQSVEKIIERNLLEVFNGRDTDSRRQPSISNMESRPIFAVEVSCQ